jgi:hypothetical protein
MPASLHAAPDAAATAARPGLLPRYELYLDPALSGETGERDVASLVTLLGAAEQRLDRVVSTGRTVWNGRGIRDGTSGGWGGPGAVALRAVRTIVWDAPVAWWFGVVLHEAFGHGGRGREFNASPGVHLGTPWEGRVSFASFDTAGLSTEQILYIYLGGTEANTQAATFLERRAVEGVTMRPIDLLYLASNRLVASRYVLRTTPDPRRDPARFFDEYSGGGDVANYLGLLHDLHGDGTGITPGGVDDRVLREYARLRRAAWWNALDPGTWWAIASALRMEARGDASPSLPLPRWGRHRFLPLFSSEWTPSGAETSIEVVMAPEAGGEVGEGIGRGGSPSWCSFIARRGRGPSRGFGALGAAADDLVRGGRFSAGGSAELWHDPRNGLGGGARAHLRLVSGPLRGLFVDLGVKSQGYWIGQPAGAGPFIGVGVRLTP